MTVWIIEPRDPLIVRDGRPFGPVPGARAVSLAFPFPSTTAGGVRTRDGLGPDGHFQPGEIQRVKQITVRGPLLVELETETGDIVQWLASVPADALLLDLDPPDVGKAVRRRLVPLQALPEANTDLPDSLSLVGMSGADRRKPCSKAPRYWHWKHFEQWLLKPQAQDGEVLALADLGQDGPVPEVRMHVRMQPETQAAAEGALFQTRGREFTFSSAGQSLAQARRLALAVATTDAPNLKEGLASLGGEQRLVMWRQSSQSLPSCPGALRESIVEHRHCRVVLLTPAYFGAGWKPTWLLGSREGVTPSLQAMAVGRPLVVSGWDFEKGKPKPTRRLAPAGTVLFLKLDGDEAAIKKWIDTTWMSCVSDEEQSRRDGFGLAVFGAWDGMFQPLEV